MAPSAPRRLTPVELDCMKALWELGEGTLHSLRERLLPSRPLAYTTVMTIMDRLARKGMVSRHKVRRAYVYRPLLSEDAARREAVERLLSDHFNNSVEALQRYLEGQAAISSDMAASHYERPARRNSPSHLKDVSLSQGNSPNRTSSELDSSLL